MSPEERAEPVGRLSRALQRETLERLAARYPAFLPRAHLASSSDEATLAANVAYLEDHGLVKATWSGASLDFDSVPLTATITAKGLDFLADDGGLSAILGVVTVKLHDETIRELLLAKVAQSDAPPGVKARLAEAIRSMPAEGLKAATLSLLQEGLDRLPDAVPLLQRWLGLG